MLFIIAYRPEFVTPWNCYPHVTRLILTRLHRAQAQSLVERLTGGKPLPVEVLDRVLDKADGVPLFLEELTKTVLESGYL